MFPIAGIVNFGSGAFRRVLLAALALLAALPISAGAQSFYVSQANGSIVRVENGGTVTPFGTATSPEGMVVDAAGNLLVADSADNVVYKFTPAGIKTTFASGLNGPSDIAIDSAGSVFVANTTAGEIVQYSSDGATSTVFASGLGDPEALTFAPNGDLFVAEQQNNRVSRFAAGDTTHTRLDFVTDIQVPVTLTFNADASRLLVGQGSGSNVFVYDRLSGARQPNFATTYSETGDITFDSGGVFYVLDSGAENITRNSPDGRTKTVVATFSSRPAGFVLLPPAIIATKADSFPDHGDGKARAGDTIDYKVTITNSGGDLGAKTHIDDPAPANTTDVAGSLRISPIAIDDDYIATKDTALTVSAPGVLGNDKGIPAASAVAIANGATAKGGTVTLNADGSFTYTPAAGFIDGDSFTYTATNGQSPDDTATAHIQVNAAPTDIGLGNSSVDENKPAGTAVGDFSATDPNLSDAPTFSLVSGTGSDDNASFTIDHDGKLLTAAVFDYETKKSYSILVRADDQHGGTFDKQFTITVNDVNEPPTATDDSYSTNEDTQLSVAAPGVLANDSDPEGHTLTASLVSGPSHGTLTMNADGSFTYTPAGNFNGSDTFTYKPNDGTSDGNVATVNITVTAVDDAPTASDDGYTTDEDTALTVGAPGVLANDTDVDSPTLTAVLVTGPAHASSFMLNSDGSFGYTPAANFNGSDSFTYQPSDGTLKGNTATVTITIKAVNDAPVGVDDSYSTNEDTALNVNTAAAGVLGNDTDVDADPLTAILVSGPAHGTLTLNSDGTFAYTPATNYNGPDSFTYKPNDGTVDGNTATVSITVTAVNDAPVVDLDSTTSGNDATISFTEVAAHDATGAVALAPNGTISDVDNANLVSLTVTLTNRPDGTAESLSANTTGTSITATAYDSSTGVLLLSGTDTVANYQKVLRTVKYNDTAAAPNTADRKIDFVANDGAANSTTSTATVTINTLDAPPIVDLDSTTVGLNSSASFTEDSPPVKIAPNGTVTDIDSANLASMTVTLTNRPDSGAESLAGDVTGTAIVADAYVPSTGVLLFHGSDTVAHYQLVLQSVKYNNTSDTPDTTNRTVSVTVNDGQKDSTPVSATISVTPHDDPPVAHADSATMLEDAGATSIDVLANDTDVDGGPKSIGSVTQPAHGAVVITGGGTGLTYQPSANYCNDGGANDTFTYTLTPGSSTATVSVAVTCVNDPPVLANSGSGLSYTENGAAAVINSAITVSDVDSANLIGATIAITANLQANKDVLSFTNTANITGAYDAGTGVLTLSGADTLANYQAALRSVKYSSTSEDPSTAARTVSYQVNDGGAANNLSNSVTSTVSVTAVNDAPTAAAFSSLPAQAGIPITYPAGKLSGSDVQEEVNNGSTVSIVTTPDSVSGGSVTINSDGSFTFTPLPSTAGSNDGSVKFTYHVTDTGHPAPGVSSSSATVSFNVAGPAIYFVKSTAVGTGNCTLGNECTLATALDASHINTATNARIFISDANTQNTAVTLNSGGWLIGQGVTNSPTNTFDALMGISTPAEGTLATRPGIGQSRPTVGSSVTLNTNSSVRGLNISSGVNTGMTDPAAAITGVTVDQVAMTTSSGTAVRLSDIAGSLTFDGLTTTSGTGASLTGNNSSATFTFSGVSISSGANVGFTSTGGGTIMVQGSGNTINTTGGQAVNIANTTIGANNTSGITFKSVSSSGASSGAGIQLVNTGNSGFFHVTGDISGTPSTTVGGDSTGGTITNVTGGDGSTAGHNAAGSGVGDGVYLENANNVTLDRMSISGASNFGVNVEGGSNFVMSYSHIQNNGDSATYDEGNIRLLNLTGNSLLESDEVNGGVEDNIRVDSDTGNVTALTINNSNIHDNNSSVGNQGILLDVMNGITAHYFFTNNTFAHNRADNINIGASGGSASATALIDVTITGNHFNGIDPAQTFASSNGILFDTANFDGHLRYDVSSNSFVPTAGNVGSKAGGDITVEANNASSAGVTSTLVEGQITNNAIGGTATGSGSAANAVPGIRAELHNQGTFTTKITGNTVQHYLGDGIEMVVGGASNGTTLGGGTFNATITGDTIKNPDPGGTGTHPGVIGTFGTGSDGTGTNSETINLDFHGNTIVNSGSDFANNVATAGGEDFRVRQRFNTDVNILGYGGGLNDTAAVVSYLQGQNNTGGTPTGSATTDNIAFPGHGFHNTASVPQPTLPASQPPLPSP